MIPLARSWTVLASWTVVLASSAVVLPSSAIVLASSAVVLTSLAVALDSIVGVSSSSAVVVLLKRAKWILKMRSQLEVMISYRTKKLFDTFPF